MAELLNSNNVVKVNFTKNVKSAETRMIANAPRTFVQPELPGVLWPDPQPAKKVFPRDPKFDPREYDRHDLDAYMARNGLCQSDNGNRCSNFAEVKSDDLTFLCKWCAQGYH